MIVQAKLGTVKPAEHALDWRHDVVIYAKGFSNQNGMPGASHEPPSGSPSSYGS